MGSAVVKSCMAATVATEAPATIHPCWLADAMVFSTGPESAKRDEGGRQFTTKPATALVAVGRLGGVKIITFFVIDDVSPTSHIYTRHATINNTYVREKTENGGPAIHNQKKNQKIIIIRL